jgi:hypothetical protein
MDHHRCNSCTMIVLTRFNTSFHLFAGGIGPGHTLLLRMKPSHACDSIACLLSVPFLALNTMHSVETLQAWGINAIQLPMNEDCWLVGSLLSPLSSALLRHNTEGQLMTSQRSRCWRAIQRLKGIGERIQKQVCLLAGKPFVTARTSMRKASVQSTSKQQYK